MQSDIKMIIVNLYRVHIVCQIIRQCAYEILYQNARMAEYVAVGKVA